MYQPRQGQICPINQPKESALRVSDCSEIRVIKKEPTTVCAAPGWQGRDSMAA